MTTVKANCILLDVRGRYYYAEEFGKFIQIEHWEYDRILNNPSLCYFSTALQKHFEWSAAVGKATTLTFLEVLERHIGGVTAKPASPALSAPPSVSALPPRPSPPALSSKTRHSKVPGNRVLGAILILVFAAILIPIFSTPKLPNASAPEQTKTTSVDSSATDSAKYAQQLKEQAMANVDLEPETRRAIPVQTEQQDDWHWEPMQLHKWDHYTTEGKTFMIAVFKERQLGDRKPEVDAAANQIRAKFYRMWDHHQIGNLEEVRIVFYK
jgi:hypothetical protein